MDEHIFDKIHDIDLKKTMEESYISYSMSVIKSRALPDVRDGLKPVQRRILFSMIELNNGPDKPHRKCARIVGDTMGKYHPHGDSSIYDALVKLAQDFNTRYPLVDGHGNFGSIDGDGAAAMRYTEARLSKISMEMLADINKDTVDFVPNFDETEKEPTVLPSKYPNLMVNGASGIAVGMATNQLSGGQKQRVAIARALINRPKVLLLDEPLGALDLKLRKQMQLELKRLQKKLNITFIYVTHDQEEALTMSDRIAIMHDGVMDQIATPTEIYEHPATKFVATFIGETNIFEGMAKIVDGDNITIGIENGDITGCGADFAAGEFITVSVRPEKMKYSYEPVEGFTIAARIVDYIYVGNIVKCVAELPNKTQVKIERLAGEEVPAIGDVVCLYWNKEDAVLIHNLDNRFYQAVENAVFA